MMPKKIEPVFEKNTDSWVQPVEFSQTDISELSKMLTGLVSADCIPATVDTLKHSCTEGRQLWKCRNHNPSATQIKAALKNILLHSTKLSEAIQTADVDTKAELTEIAQFYMDGCEQIDSLLLQLQKLAAGTEKNLARIPTSYGRQPAPVIQVKIIHDALQHHGANIPLNRWPTSTFFEIASFCFKKMGLPCTPDHAIKKYQSDINGNDDNCE